MYSSMSPSAIRIDLPWQDCLPVARDAGFDGIDLNVAVGTPADAYRQALAEHGLRPGGMKLPVNFREDDASFRADLAQLEAQIALAAEVGFSRVLAWIHPFSDTLTYKENFALHAQRLGEVARILDAHGCRLGLEFLGPKTCRDGHRYTFIYSMHQMLELADAVGPNCGLLMDSWHWHCSLGTVADVRGLRAEQVVSVHVNDAPAGVPYDQLQDLVRELPGATGVQDIGGFMEALRQIGYDGPVVPEPFYKPLESMAPAESAQLNADAVRKIWTMPPKQSLPPTMKAVAIGNSKAWTVDLPTPRPQGNQVVVKIHASPLCGSNMKAFYADDETVNGGHEGAGEVVAVAESSRLKVGDHVVMAPPSTACGTCHYCQDGDVIFCDRRPWNGYAAQYTLVADTACARVPDDMSYAHASLMGCALGPAYESLKRLGARAFDTVVVSGLGPVGLGTTALGAFMGVRIIALDPEPWRRDRADQLGASLTLDPLRDDIQTVLRQATGGGIAMGVEASGVAAAERLLIDLAVPRGAIAIVGENKGTIPLSPSNDLIRKGLNLMGCWHMNMNDVPDLITFLQRAPEKADLLISHQFGMDQVHDAFTTFAAREAAKVILLPHA